MSFQILDYLDELEKYGDVKHYQTWVHATCPVCNGKLKISKSPVKYGAYACYSDECHLKYGNPIRQSLYRPSPFRQSTLFTPKAPKAQKLIEIVKSVPFDTDVDNLLTTVKYEPPHQVRQKLQVFTYFNYECFRVVRRDYIENGKKEKEFWQEYRLPNGEYAKGLPTRLDSLPVYTAHYLQPAMVFAEGEKSATIGQKLGIAAATFPSFAYSEFHLAKYAQQLKEKGLTNVLYLEDNDDVGHKKGAMVTAYLWKQGIGAKSVNLAKLFPKYLSVKGFDLYDAYREKLITPENTESILEELVTA